MRDRGIAPRSTCRRSGPRERASPAALGPVLGGGGDRHQLANAALAPAAIWRVGWVWVLAISVLVPSAWAQAPVLRAGALRGAGTPGTAVATAPAGGPTAGAAQAEAAGESAPTDWMAVVDRFFERWLVRPLAAFIFYPVYSAARRDGTVATVPFVVAWLVAGAVFFTLRMQFINVRAFRHAIHLTRGDYDKSQDPGEVSHFQALASALSATVGLGNIAGVAIAIGAGGPGACFWLTVAGLLGMTSKFTECTLGQMYRHVDADGVVSGGPMHYLHAGLAELGWGRMGRVLAVVFTVMCVGGSFGGGCAFQVGQSLNALRQEVPALDQHPWIYGVFMALLAGAVIIGGIRSIAAVAGRIVPFMCGLYVLMVLYILATNAPLLGPAAGRILTEAFTLDAGLGGLLGVMVTGFQRAAFSNEAGVGSAAIAHSAAKTDEPVSEGIVALLEPFIDTVVVCNMTALVIIVTGVFEAPECRELVLRKQGAALTAQAFIHGGHHGFRWILYAVVILFAYSTLISWSYYGERCWTYLFGRRLSLVYKILFLVFAVLGSIVTEGNILNFSDLLILGMAFPNIAGVVFLSGRVRRALDAYWAKYRSGVLERPPRSDGGEPRRHGKRRQP